RIMLRHTSRSTPFPYTTLFRSEDGVTRVLVEHARERIEVRLVVYVEPVIFKRRGELYRLEKVSSARAGEDGDAVGFGAQFACERSEEHTSELQSQSNLVCRLLL